MSPLLWGSKFPSGPEMDAGTLQARRASGQQPTSNAKCNSSHEKDLGSLAKCSRLCQKRRKGLHKPAPISSWREPAQLVHLQPWRNLYILGLHSACTCLGAGTIRRAAQQWKEGGAAVPPLVPTKLFRKERNYHVQRGFPGGSVVKNLLPMQQTWV